MESVTKADTATVIVTQNTIKPMTFNYLMQICFFLFHLSMTSSGVDPVKMLHNLIISDMLTAATDDELGKLFWIS